MHAATNKDRAMKDSDLLYGLRHLSLELTAGCNERCVHCCTSSSPEQFVTDKLARQDYGRLLKEGRELGAASVQFIGGEPATKKYELMQLIRDARNTGYKHIEVYTNLTILPDMLLDTFKECGVHVASSFYSCDEQVHDNITRLRGSHRMTSRNMQRVLDAKLPLRVGVIGMQENQQTLDATLAYLKQIGVKQYGVDRVRGVGRGKAEAKASGIEQLCHNCWMGGITVASDATAYPCTVGREFPVGNVLTSSLQGILTGDALTNFRVQSHQIYQLRKNNREACEIPCELNYGPDQCGPDRCSPDSRCNPELGLPDPRSVHKYERIDTSQRGLVSQYGNICKPVNPSEDTCKPDERDTDDDRDCYPVNA